MEACVLIALGSNLGDSARLLRLAMAALGRLSDQPIRCSSLWRSLPLDCPPGSPQFVNGAVAFMPRAGETPESLLDQLQKIEREFGRGPKTVLNEARPMDLDLIAFGLEARNSPELILPHPRGSQRGFVLMPLAEVAPGICPPGWPGTIGELAQKMGKVEGLEKLAG